MNSKQTLPFIMEDINSRTVSALASLIITHNKRMGAYQTLSQRTAREEVKSLCTRHINESRQFVSNLSTWRSAFGGFTKIADKGDSTWDQVRSVLGLNTEKSLIGRCDLLERETLKIYKSVMPFVPATTSTDLLSQAKAIGKMLERLHELEERPVLVGSLATK